MTSQKLGFGKHPDMTYDEVAQSHPQYLKWIIRAFTNHDPRVEAAKEALSCDNTSAPHVPDFTTLIPEHFGNGKEMMDFQKAGLAFVEGSGGNVMIADQPGLGKTCQSLAYLALHPEVRPAVVVCPASLKLNWEREAGMWLETGDVVEVIKNGKPYPLTGDIGIIIINYDVLKKWLPELKAIKPQILIFDESHSIKNKGAARSKAAAQIAKIVPHKILLTGTPVLNRPSELWNQLCIIDPSRHNSKSFFSWHKRYTAAHQLHFGQKTVWDFSGASHLDELAESLKGIMIRRTKVEVLPELPAKRRQTLLVQIDNRREYNHVEKDFVSWVAEQKGNAAAERASSVEQLSMVEALRQIAIQGKMKQAIEWICDFLETGEKLVVFATHRATVDALMQEFSKVAVRLDGGMCAEEKQLSVDRFQGDDEIRLFVGNIQAAGVGITLTEASNVLFVELGWTPSLHEQAEDRCILEGQPILTPDGWRPIEDIQIGDHVIAGDGLPHQVIDAWSRLARSSHAKNSKDVTEIYVRGWQDVIKVTLDHRLLTTRGWTEAQDLRPRDKLMMPAQVGGEYMEKLQVRDEYRISSTFETPQQQLFGEYYEDTRIKPVTAQKNGRLIKLPDAIKLTTDAMFAFGYYIGDGHAYSGTDKDRYVSFAGNRTNKLQHVEAIKAWVEGYSINGSIRYDKDSEGCELRMYSGELSKMFVGEFGAKLKEKCLPEWLYTTSYEQRAAFISGWLASDGYVRCKNGCTRNEIITASYRLAADAARLLMSIGIKACVNYGKQAHAFTIGWTDGIAQTMSITRVTQRTCTKTERIYDLTIKDESSFVLGTAVMHNCHRIGQKNAVNIYYMIAENTIDGKIMDMLEAKGGITSAAIGDNIAFKIFNTGDE